MADRRDTDSPVRYSIEFLIPGWRMVGSQRCRQAVSAPSGWYLELGSIEMFLDQKLMEFRRSANGVESPVGHQALAVPEPLAECLPEIG